MRLISSPGSTATSRTWQRASALANSPWNKAAIKAGHRKPTVAIPKEPVAAAKAIQRLCIALFTQRVIFRMYA